MTLWLGAFKLEIIGRTMERKLKIFLVEEKSFADENLQQRLVDFGHEVVGVMNENTYPAINSDEVDLVMINIHLSSNDCGITLAKKISSLISLPVIFFAGKLQPAMLDNDRSQVLWKGRVVRTTIFHAQFYVPCVRVAPLLLLPRR